MSPLLLTVIAISSEVFEGDNMWACVIPTQLYLFDNLSLNY